MPPTPTVHSECFGDPCNRRLLAMTEWDFSGEYVIEARIWKSSFGILQGERGDSRSIRGTVPFGTAPFELILQMKNRPHICGLARNAECFINNLLIISGLMERWYCWWHSLTSWVDDPLLSEIWLNQWVSNQAWLLFVRLKWEIKGVLTGFYFSG